ncbi:6-bladed beta-propeller [Puteibacter caeruleilacunae]|nr:6-bladed beta-propeller [Puteibacter caeruleilacunae]
MKTTSWYLSPKRTMHVLILAVLVSFFQGCGSSSEDASIKTIDFSESSTLSEFNFLKRVKKTTFIPLEYKKNCCISSIEKLEIFHDTLFVLSDDMIYLFNKKGKYLKKLGNNGRGPKECTSIFSFSIDRDNQAVRVYDYQTNCVCSFTTSGKFIQRTKVGLIWQAEASDSNELLCYPINCFGQEPYNLVVINTIGDTLRTFPNYLKFRLNGNPFLFRIGETIFHNQKGISFHQFLSDTVFKYNSQQMALVPRFLLKGVNTLPIDLLGDLGKFEKKEDNYNWLERIQESRRFLFFNAKMHGKNTNFIYNKKQNRLSRVIGPETGGAPKTLAESNFFWPNSVSSKDRMIRFWTAYSFKNYYKEIVKDKESLKYLAAHQCPRFEGFYNSVDINDNPIIQVTWMN